MPILLILKVSVQGQGHYKVVFEKFGTPYLLNDLKYHSPIWMCNILQCESDIFCVTKMTSLHRKGHKVPRSRSDQSHIQKYVTTVTPDGWKDFNQMLNKYFIPLLK